MKQRWWWMLCMVLAVYAASCSSNPEVAAVDPTSSTADQSPTTAETIATASVNGSSPSTTTTADLDVAQIEDVALSYFDDVANGRTSDSAEPASPAELYSAFLEDIRITSGQTSSAVSVAAGDVVLKTEYVDGTTNTVTFSDIEVSPEGVRNFAINGNLISDRIAVSRQPVNSNGVEVIRAISYLSVSGDHYVAATTTNTNDKEFDAGGPPSFVNSDGQQVESDSFLETYSVRPGATAVVAFTFPGGDTPSGTVYIDGFTHDFATDVPLVIEVSQYSE